ncbi:MAG TPA: glycosyltransferase family 39 protein, partial [Acidobacteriaceae bacterium]|nr:glycosyltransferase family 39 protein [Acidobacteriaceae bacterium]
LRLWFLQHPMLPDDDTDVYTELAGNLFHHGTYGIVADGVIEPTLIRVPGYPVFLGLMFRLFGDGNFNAVLLAQIGLDLVACWLIASFVRDQVSERAGTIAIFVGALCPFTAAYSATALTESLSVLAVSLGLWSTSRLLAAQAQGKTAWAATAYAGGAIGMAMLLRPDGVLLGASIAAAIVWYGWQQRQLVLCTRNAMVCGAIAMFMLVPWTVRNWRTFHVVQPLAPRRVNDPGEYVTYGFYQWMNTWSVDIVSTGSVFWNVGSDKIDINDLPVRAFDSAAQRHETAALLDEYNAKKTVTPALDAKFAALAHERIRNHPLRCLVWVPVLRVLDMLLRPRTETLSLEADWWRFAASRSHMIETAVLGILNVSLVLLGIAGMRRLRWMVLPLTYVILRCLLLSTMENSEPRYTLEMLPIWSAAAACALALRLVPVPKPVWIPSEEVPA